MAALGLAVALTATAASARAGFSFSDEEAQSRAGSAAHGGPIVSERCRGNVAGRRTIVVIGARLDGRLRTAQSAYTRHATSVVRSLQTFGVRTYSKTALRRRIAQAEIDAYFANDPDAALAASRRLGAELAVRGVIDTRRSYNEMMGLPEVGVSIALSLIDARGRVVASATAHTSSYAGRDTLAMAATLLDEQAPAVVARLVGDYCRTTHRR